ncbi:isocitrate lyase/PEP mutase family protein [Roseomonas chloroacetimidivorans]|uniref:isocitrate lyase/PEP mutase family protein n=1 Tax=Roseomonas chloroacetimidivorans TaxID=1766656 RepID=UPI003C77A640
MSRHTRTLRELMRGPELLVAPGVADALNARLVGRMGFQAVYMTGAGTAATRLGRPDIGLLSVTEMVDNAERIADAASVPLIADADTGYGGVMNVQRTIRAYERAGVAGVHIEDQVWPKRCGHLDGKAVVPAEEMAAKIRAACDARHDPDFVVIARTDALAVEGFERAMDRARLYEAAGADMIFIEAPRTLEQLRAIPAAFGVPTVFNMSASGKTPFRTAAELRDMGFRLAIYPNFLLLAGLTAARQVLEELRSTGTVEGVAGRMTSFPEFLDLVGLAEVRESEARYAVAEELRVGF